ncbi:hypothetical protein EW146_g7725 [Bondarzewia mesenterica]|uniref:Uncharacterized protein n=1 Tax=Bondarzewia mesenterica TaxID=1095465 RepID=A0A4S4LQL8_9AGAM|nr:hypothetical protein EW146_g7725 [Bondarzewia mesenterica]
MERSIICQHTKCRCAFYSLILIQLLTISLAVLLRSPPSPPEEKSKQRETIEMRRLTTVRNAWDAPYELDYHVLLLETVNDMKINGRDFDYSNTVTILQSSGTGKSRMVDEQAALVFTIPFNLRAQRETEVLAFPPPDDSVRDHLVKPCDTYDAVRVHYFVFFSRLFTTVRKRLQSLLGQRTLPYETLTKEWREHLRSDKSPTAREDLYNAVIEEATEEFLNNIRRNHEPTWTKGGATSMDEHAASSEAIEELKNLVWVIDPSWKVGEVSGRPVKIVLYFDEAHELVRRKAPKNEYGKTLYDVLLSVFNDFLPFPVFAIFLSTTSHIAYFASTQNQVRSSRAAASGHLQPPITETPFDCAPDFPIIPGKLTLEEVAAVPFMAKFGRPLFWSMFRDIQNDVRILQLSTSVLKMARSKLVCNTDVEKSFDDSSATARLAVADVRLCLEYEPRRQQNQMVVAELVASHMRVAYSVPKHREYLRSGYSSEPLLAEAAAMQLKHWRKKRRTTLIDTLQQYMENGLLNLGERGEVVARLLVMEAYDRAVLREHGQRMLFSLGCHVTTFIKELFEDNIAQQILDSRPDNVADGLTFREAFEDARVRFTHFAKLGDSSVTSTDGLFAAFVRGMAFIAKTGQAVIDFLIPVLLRNELLREEVMTGILVQVNRRRTAGSAAACDVKAEDISLFPMSDLFTDDRRPYCTIVMELGVQPANPQQASKTKKLAQNLRPHDDTQTSPSRVAIKQVGATRGELRSASEARTKLVHPRYNIYAYGCSGTVYKGIMPEDKDTYTSLLASRDLLSEHPRTSDGAIAAVRRLKPSWTVGKECFHWIQNTSLGHVVDEEEVEGIVISQYGS